jgi:VanZ family protein
MPFVNSIHTKKSHFLYRWGPSLLVMVVIFTISSFPSTTIPDYGAFDFLVKKGSHLLGYTLLGLAYCHALSVKGARQAILAWILAVLFAISDEFHQSFVPGRTAWGVDVLIDSSGALLGILIWRLFHRNNR